MIDTDKYEGHQPAPWRWVKPTGEWFLYAEKGNYSDPTHREDEATYDLIADAPLLLEEVKRLHEIEREWELLWSKLEDYPDICAELISFMESEEE